MGPRIREDNGKGESGGRAVPEPPLRGVGRTAYNGRPQGSPLQEKDGGVGEGDGSPHPRGQREGESGGGRFPNRPYEGLVAQHITGDHKGRPYGKGDGSPHPRTTGGGVGGRAVPEPPLRGVGRTAYNGRPQGSPLRGEDGGVGEGGWVPASARTTGGGVGGGRFPNRPYEGLVAQHITGDHKGRPYGRMAGWGKGDGSPHPRGQREGESGAGGSRTAPTRGWSHSI